MNNENNKKTNIMRKYIYLIKTVLLLILFSNSAFSQSGAPTTQGKDFWVTFGANHLRIADSGDNYYTVSLRVRIAARETTNVQFTFTRDGSSRNFTVAAGQVYTYIMTTEEAALIYHDHTTTNGTTNKSLHVTSDRDISLYAINLATASTDATNILPVNAYGVEYYTLSYESVVNLRDGYTIIANEDDTEIRDNGALRATLSRGEVYSFYSSTSLSAGADLTGRRITSNKRFAMFTTNESTNIPKGYGTPDCLFQQLMPVHSWGTRFLVPITNPVRPQPRDRNIIRILASQDGTVITSNAYPMPSSPGAGSFNLNAGQFVQIQSTTTSRVVTINSNKPVAVVSYLPGSSYFSSPQFSDPAMAWIPPLEQTIPDATITPFFAGTHLLDDQHYAMIVTPTATKNNTTIAVGAETSQALFNDSWIDNAASGHSFYQMRFSDANKDDVYRFVNPAGMIIMAYGMGPAESYYYMAAGGVSNLEGAFYINDIYYLSADGTSICGSSLSVRSDINFPLSASPGRIRWFVNNQEVSQQDQLQWSIPSLPFNTYTIKMVALSSDNRTFELESTVTLTRISTPDMIKIAENVHSPGTLLYTCIGEKATMTASLATAGSVTNPVYKWYGAPTGGTPLHTGATFVTTAAITADTTFYVSVSGDNYCEGARLTVNIKAMPCTDNMTICIGEKAIIEASLEASGSITNPVYKWYAAPTGGIPLHTGATFTSATALTTDTAFYVSVEWDDFCEGPRRKVNVTVKDCADMAKKSATLLPNTFVDNGSYPNPISILGSEVVRYAISATNPTNVPVKILITDTLPAYIQFVNDGTASPAVTPTNTTAPPNPVRQVLKWEFPSVPVDGNRTVSFSATPQPGAVASQPLFINRAMVSFVRSPGDTVHIQTNGTFHQGAGISIMTFSAGIGGDIFNATEQVLDYMSTPASGIIIAPEEGYKFAGWSHRDYTSLRGATIKAQAGIMHYDTLMVYGNVELHAEFVPVEALLKEEQEESISEMPEEDKVWAVKGELLITTTTAGSIVRIYSTEGVLRELHTIVSAGTTSRKLSRGIYIVTINNGIGHKVRVE